MNKSELSTFASSLKFELDPFQVKACVALEAGHGVLVCAPTGAGKTVVGEFAVHLALAAGRKCFYTTPIKALSNQKYAELVERYGPGQVGLLTGDSSINSDAPVVVMTTEVLRNMLYANSEALRGLSHVVMDEVHYLADRFRGAVWEEVILHLSEDVRLVSLSATVSNAEEFGAWMETVRGDTTVVVDETRPIPLWQHIMSVGESSISSTVVVILLPGRRPCSSTRIWFATSSSVRLSNASRAGSRVAADDAAATRVPTISGPCHDLTSSLSSISPDCSRPSLSSSAAPVVMRLLHSACGPDWISLRRSRSARSTPSSRNTPGGNYPKRISKFSDIGTGARHYDADWHLTMPACCRHSARQSRNCSSRGGSCGRSSRPRRWPSASTCRHARWCSNVWSSTTVNRTPN